MAKAFALEFFLARELGKPKTADSHSARIPASYIQEYSLTETRRLFSFYPTDLLRGVLLSIDRWHNMNIGRFVADVTNNLGILDAVPCYSRLLPK